MLRNIRLLYIHNFLSDFFPQWPYLVIYFQSITGSYTSALSVLAIETLTSALLDIPTGIFSDRVGRRYTIALGSLCAAVGTSLYAAAYGVHLLYMGAFFTGFSQCLFSGNNNALLYESLKTEGIEDQYHHYRGGTGSMFQLALCLSAFAAIFLSQYGLRFIFMIAVVPQVIAIFVSLMFEKPRIHVQAKHTNLTVFKEAFIRMWGNPRLMFLVLGRALNYGIGEASFKFKTAFVSLFWPIWAIGLYRGLNHALGFIGFQISGRIIDRIKPAYIFVARDFYWFSTNVVALLLSNVFSPIILVTGAILFGPGEVASDHLMQKEFTDEQRATMGSLASSVMSIVFAIACLAIGLVSDFYGLNAGVVFIAFITLLPVPVYLWLFRNAF